MTLRLPSRGRFVAVLAALFSSLALWAAINPYDRGDWILENSLVAVMVGILVASRKKLPLSRVSYLLIFLFLCLHEVGSHYTYAKVPYRECASSWFGAAPPGPDDRNHFDRFVHFAYGLLIYYPFREVVLRISDLKGFWGYFLPLDVMMSSSMVYELVEWGAAEVFGEGLGAAFLGTQGDVWDAHKDMLLASLGAMLAMGAVAALNARLQRDFAREWVESLRVKNPRPLGEEEALRLLRKK
jgi:putative membrane protein